MASFTFNGRSYDWAEVDTLTMGETWLLQRYTGKTYDKVLAAFVDGGLDTEALGGLIHISIARVEREETESSIKQAVSNMPQAMLADLLMAISEEVDESSVPPPDVTSNEGSSSDSGASGTHTGEPPQENAPRNGSGSPGSATGATSDPVIWGR